MRYLLTAFTILFSALFLFSCAPVGVGVQVPGAPVYHQSHHHGHGPPPHAPAHGYRHKYHQGHELIYDSRIGAYIVLNIPETYFGNNLYIRMSTDGRWMVSARLNSGWRIAVGSEVPPRLKTHKKKGKGHGKQKYDPDENHYYHRQ